MTKELFFNKEKLKGVKIKEHARGTLDDEKCLDIRQLMNSLGCDPRDTY